MRDRTLIVVCSPAFCPEYAYMATDALALASRPLNTSAELVEHARVWVLYADGVYILVEIVNENDLHQPDLTFEENLAMRELHAELSNLSLWTSAPGTYMICVFSSLMPYPSQLCQAHMAGTILQQWTTLTGPSKTLSSQRRCQDVCSHNFLPCIPGCMLPASMTAVLVSRSVAPGVQGAHDGHCDDHPNDHEQEEPARHEAPRPLLVALCHDQLGGAPLDVPLGLPHLHAWDTQAWHCAPSYPARLHHSIHSLEFAISSGAVQCSERWYECFHQY